MKTFTEKVLAVVAKIPKGSVYTYAQVAQKVGSPRAVRAVGNTIAKNYDPNIYCHRVVRSDGSLGGYNRGVKEKKRKLMKEGVEFTGDRVILKGNT